MLKKTINHWLNKIPSNVNKRDAEIILAQLLNKNQTFILAHPEYVVPFFIGLKFLRLIKKRNSGWPLAYLTGHKEFFGLDFLVNQNTLIPRPETELIVELVIEKIKENPNTLLIDVGTGTGCIPISIIKNIPQKIKTFGLDISKKALKVAQNNASQNQVEIEFIQSNLLTNFPNINFSQFSQIIITANLPYLTATEFSSEKSIQHEPYSALVASNNGLELYFQLITQLKKLLGEKNNRVITLLCEINPNQFKALKIALTNAFFHAQFLTYKDLAGFDRVLCTSWRG